MSGATREPTFVAGPERVSQGHLACPGCGIMPAYRWAMKVFGPRTVLVTPACCFAVVDGPFPTSASTVPFLHTAFEAAAAYASGVRAGLDVLRTEGEEDVTVLVWAGDGGTFDIGLQSLSAAAERNEDMVYVCYDNEAYMNTGIQRSSATPRGAWTTTTPAGGGKREPKKDLGAILAAHQVPYFATASLSHPDDLVRKLETAKGLRGFRMIHYLCPCPTGWKADSKDMVALARGAVESGVFPLYEIFDGERYVVNHAPAWTPLRDYAKLQGRFKHLGDAGLAAMETEARRRFARLEALASLAMPDGRAAATPA